MKKIIQENVAHPVPRTLSVQVAVCYKTWESRRWSAHYSCHIKDLWAEKTRPCQDKQGHQKEDFMAILVWIHIYLGYTATLLHSNISNKTESAFMSCFLWCWQNGPSSCIKDYDYQFGTSYSVGSLPYICLMTAIQLKADSCLATAL